MSHFERAIIPVLKHEGGYVNHPSDPGGETKYGITKRNYHHLDIRNLTREQAIEIYRRDYWRDYMDAMPYRIAAKLFDMSVNMGHQQANKLLQRAAGVVDDGAIGPRTLKAINEIDPGALLDRIIAEQKRFYAALIAKRPSMAVFEKGWHRRADWKPELA